MQLKKIVCTALSAAMLGSILPSVYAEQNSKKYIHISFDDVNICLNDITVNEDRYNSAFDNEFLGDLKAFHDEYGAVFTLNCFTDTGDFNIENLTDKFKADLGSASDWLKFSFHAKAGNTRYSSDKTDEISNDYNTFKNAVINASGTEESIDSIVRLGFFTGTVNNMKALHYEGVNGFLTADDDREVNYYLSENDREYIKKNNQLYDSLNDLCAIHTQTRMENITDVSAEFEKISAIDNGDVTMIELFTHEAVYDKEKMSEYMDAIRENGYIFDFAENHIDDIKKWQEENPREENKKSYVSVDSNTGTVTYDLSSYIADNISSDCLITDNEYEGLEGLLFNGGTNWWVVKNKRIEMYKEGSIEYIPDVNGTLSIVGASKKSDSSRYLSICENEASPTENIVIDGKTTTETTAGIKVMAGKKYYIMGYGSYIKQIIFEPNLNSASYTVNAVCDGENIAIINEGVFDEEETEKKVWFSRYISDSDGNWYKLKNMPALGTSEAYEKTVTLDEPVCNIEYERSDSTVYFAEAEKLFADAASRVHSWNGYSGGGYVKAPANERETGLIPAGVYTVTIGYKAAKTDSFTQPSISCNDTVLLEGNLVSNTTGETSKTVTIPVDSTLKLNTGSGNNEIDYIVVTKEDDWIGVTDNGKEITGGIWHFDNSTHTLGVTYQTDKSDGKILFEVYEGGELKESKETDNYADGAYRLEIPYDIKEYNAGFNINVYYVNNESRTLIKSIYEKQYRLSSGTKIDFTDGEVIGCIGDSITHVDTEGMESYHEVLYNYLMTHYPNKKLYIKNMGTASASAKDLLSGYDGYSAIDTYISENPNMSKAFVMLGMNDIDRDLYESDKYDSTEEKREEKIQEYRENMSQIIEKLKSADIDVILVTPSIYDNTRIGSASNYSNRGLMKCSEIVKELASEKDCKVISLNEEMAFINKAVQAENPYDTLIDAYMDNVHPGEFGHNVMGYLMLRQMGADSNEVVLSSKNNINSTVSNARVYNNYVSYDYSVKSLPMAETAGYRRADVYTGLTKDLNNHIIREDLPQGTYDIKIDGISLGEYSDKELRDGVNAALNSAYPAQSAAQEAQNINIDRSKYEVKLQNAVRYNVFHKYVNESTYKKINENKEEYLSLVNKRIDEMYSRVMEETSAIHHLEITLCDGNEELLLPNMFHENMVLQEGKANIYGKGKSGVKYTAALENTGEKYSGETVAEDGYFKISIPDAPASMMPYKLTVTSDNDYICINNVYVGEVYLLAGQSNMEMRLDHWYGTDKTKFDEDAHNIMSVYGDRIKFMVLSNQQHSEPLFNAPLLTQDTINYTLPSGTVPGIWNNMNESTYKLISLIGMYYANDILRDSKTNGPVGLLCNSVGGTEIDTWMKNGSAENYNGHIAPFEDYGVRGVLWYQGETDADRGDDYDVKAYKNRFAQLINDYREVFDDEELPFLYVQLASYDNNSGKIDFAPIRDSQRRALELVKNNRNVAMVSSADTATTSTKNIHPDGKDIVADRLYSAAKNIIYGDKSVGYEGPLVDYVDFGNGKATVHFKNTSIEGGLTAKSTFDNFEIAGDDRNYVTAYAEIAGDTVVVASDKVINPKYVRYAYSNVINLTLYNGIGLPASPFTTEDYTKVTCIGDSITYGHGLYNRSEQNPPKVLSGMLNSDEDLNGEYSVYNRGKSGWCVSGDYKYMTSDGGSEWLSAKKDRSDIYTIALGTNDSKNGVDDNGKLNFEKVLNGTFANDYMAMIDGILEYNENAKIYICLPIPSLEIIQENASDIGLINESRLTVVRDELRKIYKLAHERYGDSIGFADTFSAFINAINGDVITEADNDMYKSPSYQSGSITSFNDYATVNGKYLYNKNFGSDRKQLNIDTIHPGGAGAELIAKTLFDTIKLNAVSSEYNISYNLDGGYIDDINQYNKYIKGKAMELPTPVKNGYTFGGWYDNDKFMGNAISGITEDDIGNKEFWAKWIESDSKETNIEVLGGYADKLAVKRIDNKDNIQIVVTVNDEKVLSELNMYLASYETDKSLKSVQTILPEVKDGKVIINILSEAEINGENTKLMIWNKEQSPIIAAVSNVK